MAIWDLFSRRASACDGVEDVYIYDIIPEKFRKQLVLILDRVFGYQAGLRGHTTFYDFVCRILREEYGELSLSGRRNVCNELNQMILEDDDITRVLDVVELSCRIAQNYNSFRNIYVCNMTALKFFIDELNVRMRDNDMGYEFVDGRVVRIDSRFVHVEVVRPALLLLSDSAYRGAQEEFLDAHANYRHGNYKDALVGSLKAMESVLKVICDRRGWVYPPRGTCKNLLDVCFEQMLIPEFWQAHMGALRALLEGGVPTGRNRLAGHGQGAEPVEVPAHIAAYVLHMTASAIVFLVESEKALS